MKFMFNTVANQVKKKYKYTLLVKADSLRDVVCYQHSYHQPIDGDDTSHDHRDDGLHDELWPHH